MGLIAVDVDAVELATVEANASSKGEYKRALAAFVESGKKAQKFAVGEDGKPTAASIKAGFENAVRKAKEEAAKDNRSTVADYIQVSTHEGAVYIVRKDAPVATTETTDTPAAAETGAESDSEAGTTEQ